MTIDERLASLGADVTDHRLTRPDGRVVAWSESGVADGRPVLRVPGTPGCRFSIRADRTPWIERNLRVITTERPGYGASTRLEGRAFVEHSDDLGRDPRQPRHRRVAGLRRQRSQPAHPRPRLPAPGPRDRRDDRRRRRPTGTG